MQRDRELEILDRVMAHRDAGNTTDMAPEMYTNPVASYVDPDHYNVEFNRLFRDCPIVACLTSDVESPGDYLTLEIAEVPVLVVRSDDGVVRAFRNVCRHRGVCVAEGRGEAAASFTCRFHGWSYRRDGTLIRPTHATGFSELDPSRRSLDELACDETAGLVFVHLDAAPDTLDADDWLGELGTELSAFNLGGFTRFETRVGNQDVNWKLMGDTFCEQYHLRHLHRDSFALTVQSDNSLYDAYGRHGRMVTPNSSIEQLDQLPRNQWPMFPHVILNYMIVPNTVLLVQAGSFHLFQLWPIGPERTTSMTTLYCATPPDNDKDRARLKKSNDFVLDTIDNEDYRMCEQTQRSFRSGAQTHIVFGRNEPGLIHYHRSLDGLLADDPPTRPAAHS